jgi:hypothetical protein
MQDPNPEPTGWKPTVSTLAGGGIGGSIAYLIILGFDKILHTTFDPLAYVALTSVCSTVVGYFFPDGGRK